MYDWDLRYGQTTVIRLLLVCPVLELAGKLCGRRTSSRRTLSVRVPATNSFGAGKAPSAVGPKSLVVLEPPLHCE